ncbi:MAG: universal stress protein, partial [Chloroflexi bacterium]|nr:universal stress protein [Chloroflexota bacterium]
SELSESVLPYVEDIARKLDLEVLLVRVARFISYSYAGVADIEAEIEREASEYLNGVAERLRAKGLRVQWKALKGAPAVKIVEEAQTEPLDLIVLATHGRSGFRRWLLGSVAEAVVRASGDPVLIIPPQTDGK